MSERKAITILHLSDIQFGANHRFGVDTKTEDGKIETLLGRLCDDLKEMKEGYKLSPELVVVTGDLAEWGMKKEYDDVAAFLSGLMDFTKLGKDRIALVPGNHDINRKKCSSYFDDCEGDGLTPDEPYWKKWEPFKAFFDESYKSISSIKFTEKEPWTFYRIEDLKIIIAGLNSTMKESHRDDDHYGFCGERQYKWFAGNLKAYEQDGWFRIGAIHHNIRRHAIDDDANLRDENDLEKYLADCLNIILHGHVHKAEISWLDNVCPVLATGSTALKASKRPEEVPNQYQIIRIEKDKISRWCRAYSHVQRKWIGDNLPILGGNDWKQEKIVDFKNVHGTFQGDIKKPRIDPHPQADEVFILNEAVTNYRQKIKSFHEFLPAAGFAMQLKVPIRLEDIHVPLHAMMDLSGVKETEFSCSEHAENYFQGRDCGREISLLKAAHQSEKKKYRGIVILGDPGSGKTTHLKRLMLWCLDKGPESLGFPKDMLPVFLPLRRLDDLEKGLDAFIQKELAGPHLNTPKGFGKRLLDRGNLLFLLDGLDEVSNIVRREQVAAWILEASKYYSQCHFIVTCRFAGYSPKVRMDSGFLEMHIRPFSVDQAAEFITTWYHIVEKGLAEDQEQAETIAKEKAGDLIKTIRDPDFRSTRVAALTRNPLLLTNICLVHRFRGSLPEKRSRLYEDCIDVLLEHWRKAKGLKVEFSARDARQALQPAALWLHEEDCRTQATAKELEPHIAPVLKAIGWQKGSVHDFLKTIRDESGLLTGWDQQNYGFMHLGFQEYLAAREIRSRFFEDPAVLAKQAKRFGQSWWQEVTLLMLALEDPFLFKPFMREVVKLPQFVEHSGFVESCLNDSSERSVLPFLELLEAPPGKDQELWKRQLYALTIAERLDPDSIKQIRQKLANHPSDDIRARFTSQAKQATRQMIQAKRGGYQLIRIPAGTFFMGSDPSEEGHDNDEGPKHTVTVPEFYMGQYPVTNEEYGNFLKENPKVSEPAYWVEHRYNQPKQPVVGVSWDDAKCYAEWAGLRLPSEAEWEYACRSGTTTIYYSGDKEEDLARVGWYKKNSGDSLHPVGGKEPNAFGLYDMHGNVLEWVEDDWHDNYRGAPSDGIAWINKKNRGTYRVARGGSWLYVAFSCRSVMRNGYSPVARYYVLGFRLSRSVSLGP